VWDFKLSPWFISESGASGLLHSINWLKFNMFWDISTAPSGFKKNAWYNWFGWIHRLRCGRSLVFQTTSVNFNSLTLCNSRCTRFCNTMWSAQITNFSMNYLLTLFILLRCIYSNYQKKTIYKPWREREREVMFY